MQIDRDQVRSITFRNFDAILPQYVVVKYLHNEQEWQVVSLEILDENKTVLADGIEFANLPKPSQMAILGQLHTHDHEERQRRHGLVRLWQDLQAVERAQ